MPFRPAIELIVRRADVAECSHIVHAAVSNADGSHIDGFGDPHLVTTLRSSGKPLQLAPVFTLPSDPSFHLNTEEIAICCASHPGTPRHAALAASVLSLSGFLPDNLVCGPPPEHPSPLVHGCSGNHAALLLLAKRLGADLDTYEQPDNPAQQHILELLQEMSGCTNVLIAIDGCGVPTFGMPLSNMARAFANLIRPGAPWAPIPDAMAQHSDLLGPIERIDGCLIRATSGRLIAKTGAEGLLCIANRENGLAAAVKIADGNSRAIGLAAVTVVSNLGWLTAEELDHDELRHHRKPILQPAPNGIACWLEPKY